LFDQDDHEFLHQSFLFSFNLGSSKAHKWLDRI